MSLAQLHPFEWVKLFTISGTKQTHHCPSGPAQAFVYYSCLASSHECDPLWQDLTLLSVWWWLKWDLQIWWVMFMEEKPPHRSNIVLPALIMNGKKTKRSSYCSRSHSAYDSKLRFHYRTSDMDLRAEASACGQEDSEFQDQLVSHGYTKRSCFL